MTQADKKEPAYLISAFRKWGKRFKRSAWNILGNEVEAEDALQDAFLKLWPMREDIVSEDEAARLMTATVQNLSIDALRRRTAEQERLREAAGVLTEEEDPDVVESREKRWKEVEQIIVRELTPLTRDIMERKELKGQDYGVIAQELDMTEGAVRMHVSRARQTIRICYLKLKKP